MSRKVELNRNVDNFKSLYLCIVILKFQALLFIGECPVCRLKNVPKWLWLRKPSLSLISLMVRQGFWSNSTASWMTVSAIRVLADLPLTSLQTALRYLDEMFICEAHQATGRFFTDTFSKRLLTAILCGSTRFKDIQEAVHGVSEKVLTERLRQMQDDRLIERHECYGYPPRVEYQLTEHGKHLYAIVYQMTEWGLEHRRQMLGG